MQAPTHSLEILVTGASGGIGSAIVEELQKRHCHVIGTDRNDADMSSYEDIKHLALSALQEKLDWVVYAHGFIDAETDLAKQLRENITATFDINTLSNIYLTQMLLSRIGTGIIFISSTAALSPNGRFAAYSASKAAVNAFAQALAKHRPALTCITVCPGPTMTAMRKKIASDAALSQSPEAVARTVADIISGRSKYKSGDIVIVKDGNDSLYREL
ncbi:MAG: hypothetical protein UY39_C0001G0006 [Candidatus Kaiserbacteria bacterium GW2011_GWC2_49_12]|uniref:Uncharacterized protein n=1 Tax=Candidatus Kaiserbacteria bacterium GW2011_GWC2_49_12 TaxID=1618675 RepID=A0A0G1VNU6_9BACT|nr:MAG: hypothetical protein UY39_C0001G0006 [Candidatus Kaiserbacteria bacterium GW2011_GWC2_49_12]